MSSLTIALCTTVIFSCALGNIVKRAGSEEMYCSSDCMKDIKKRMEEVEKKVTDECSPSPCQNGGACVDGVYDYSCKCPAGYEGKACEKKVSACDSSPCKNEGACQNQGDGYSCTCKAGYAGKNCESATTCPLKGDASYTCNKPGKTCDHIPNGECFQYECKCKPGYLQHDKTGCCVKECSQFGDYMGSTHYLVGIDLDVEPISLFKIPEKPWGQGWVYECSNACRKNKDCAFAITYNAYISECCVSRKNNTCGLFGVNALGRVSKYEINIPYPLPHYNNMKHVMERKRCVD